MNYPDWKRKQLSLIRYKVILIDAEGGETKIEATDADGACEAAGRLERMMNTYLQQEYDWVVETSLKQGAGNE